MVPLPSLSSPRAFTAPFTSQCLQGSQMPLCLSQQALPSLEGWQTKDVPSWPQGPLRPQDRGEIQYGVWEIGWLEALESGVGTESIPQGCH